METTNPILSFFPRLDESPSQTHDSEPVRKKSNSSASMDSIDLNELLQVKKEENLPIAKEKSFCARLCQYLRP